MIKQYICYKKNCWSTDFSVLMDAASKEEEHPDENLSERATPHTHKEENKKEELSEEISTAIGEVKEEKEADYMLFYEEKNKNIGNEESYALKSPISAPISHDHESLEVNEFLIEKSPTGIRHSKVYYTIPEQLKKKGILLDYGAF